MSIKRFIEKWNVAYESKEQQLEFAKEMRKDLKELVKKQMSKPVQMEVAIEPIETKRACLGENEYEGCSKYPNCTGCEYYKPIKNKKYE